MERWELINKSLYNILETPGHWLSSPAKDPRRACERHIILLYVLRTLRNRYSRNTSAAEVSFAYCFRTETTRLPSRSWILGQPIWSHKFPGQLAVFLLQKGAPIPFRGPLVHSRLSSAGLFSG